MISQEKPHPNRDKAKKTLKKHHDRKKSVKSEEAGGRKAVKEAGDCQEAAGGGSCLHYQVFWREEMGLAV